MVQYPSSRPPRPHATYGWARARYRLTDEDRTYDNWSNQRESGDRPESDRSAPRPTPWRPFRVVSARSIAQLALGGHASPALSGEAAEPIGLLFWHFLS